MKNIAWVLLTTSITFIAGISNAYSIPLQQHAVLAPSLDQQLRTTLTKPGRNDTNLFDQMLTTEPDTALKPDAPLPTTATPPIVDKAKIQQAYNQQGLHFEPNLGQTNDEVKYTARGPGYTLFLTGTEAVFSLAAPRKLEDTKQPADVNAIPDPMAELEAEQNIAPPEVLRMQMLGETFNPKAKISGLEKRNSYSNYYLGNDKDKWATNVPHYSKVEYEDVYPGIDLVYYGNPQQLEYDFVVAPGADPNQIQLAFEGADDIRIADNGKLELTVNDREVAFKAPVIYQVKAGERAIIAGNYSIEENQLRLADKTITKTKVGFQLATYDASLPLVIDPVLVYSTYLGGIDTDIGNGIAVDSNGDAVITGQTPSINFPTTSGSYQATHVGIYDAFVTRLDSSGHLVFSTYLGGYSDDYGRGIAVDSNGDAVITGYTNSTNFPTANALQGSLAGNNDAFVTRLDSSGQLVFSTYLGGNGTDGGNGVAVDASGNALVTGFTISTNFPTANALQGSLVGVRSDVFITKLDASGQLVFSTYLGGSNLDNGRGVAVDTNGDVVVTGNTSSTNFPTTNALQGSIAGSNDCFVTRLDSNGQLVFSTYLGGSGNDVGYSVAVDTNGDAVVIGQTISTNFPTANAQQGIIANAGSNDNFVTRLDNNGQLVFSTYLGGSSWDYGNSVAVDTNGDAVVTGRTFSTDFPTINALQGSIAGSNDSFVAQLDSNGQLIFSTYLGGGGNDVGNSVAVDSNGDAVITGDTTSPNFPTSSGAYQATDPSTNQYDAFITRISFDDNQAPTADDLSVTTAEDTDLAIELTGTDPDGDTLDFTVVDQPLNGQLQGTEPFLTYIPDPDFNGSDSFTYTASDGSLDSNPATVTITVTPENDAPIADNINATTDEEVAVNFTLTATDPESDPITFAVSTPPANGVLTGTAPNLTYTPDTDFFGSDSFEFTASDGSLDSVPGIVTITVNNINDAPTATSDSVNTDEETPVDFTLSGTDPDGDDLTFTFNSTPAHGTLTGTIPNLTYTPDANFVGTDFITYRANDGTVDSIVATIGLIVANTNDSPVADAQSVSTDEDTPVNITLTGSDPDTADTLTYAVVAGPANGSLTGTAPNLTYTPNADYNGSDSFTFKVNDGTVDSANATVSITINPSNDVPTATAQTVSTDEDTATTITLAGADPDGDTLTYSVVTQPANGTLTGTAPNLTYTPDADYNGPDSFTFKVNDGTVDSAPATVTINVSGTNDAPVADAQTLTTDEDTPLTITLTGSDLDGDTLTYSVVTQPANGTLTGTAPNLTYTPNADYNGADSFTFKVNDGTVDSATATVSITVNGTNDAPVADAQTVTTDEDTPLTIALTGSDLDGDGLTFSVVTQPANGTLTGTAPNLTYTPNTDYNGADSFTFKVNDNTVDSAPATVTINVNGTNDAPVADAQSLTTDEDTPLTITLTGSDLDGDGLTYTVVTAPTNGALSGTAPNLTYTPNADYNGADSFNFKVNDNTVDSAPATVTINVNGTNDAPVADAQTVTTDEDTTATITLTGSDLDGDGLTYSVVIDPTNGSLSGTAPNLTYIPDPDYNGSDSFTFKVNDGTVDSAPATVSINVSNTNDAPVATPQTISTDEDTPVNFVLTGSDLDGDGITFNVVGGPNNGGITGTTPNLTYTPNPDFNGSDSISFTVNDGSVDSAPATVTISVSNTNDAPVANAQTVSTDEDTPANITLTGSDLDGDGLTFNVVGGPSDGSLTGTAPNLTYTPNPDFNGSDSISFTVNDGTVDSAAATVSINVNGTNDAPTANAQNVNTAEDTPVTLTLSGIDPDGDMLSYTVISGPSSGVLSGTAPALVYTPGTDFFGSDSFTFKVNDGAIDSPAATVSINISGTSDAPTATAQTLVTAEDTALNITLSGNDPDGDSLNYIVSAQPSNGTLTGTVPNLTYTPNTNYSGTDSFSFIVYDDISNSAPASIDITITDTNDTPVADNQSVTTDEDITALIFLTGSDPDDDPLGYTVETQPANGSLSGTAPALSYTPNPDFNGSDSFTFSVDDGTTTSTEATVSITISPVNDAPVADSQLITLAEDSTANILLTGSDPEGDNLSFTIVTPPTNGSLSGTAPELTYTPNPDYNGSDSFSFVVNDGTVDSTPATVTLDITPVPDDNWQTTASYLNDLSSFNPDWRYQWNENGPIGDSANYSAMIWNGNKYNATGLQARPSDDELRYGMLSPTGGHPGMGVDQGVADDRYVIASYTVPTAGVYRLSNSSLQQSTCAYSTGLDLRLYVNDQQLDQQSVPGDGSAISFDQLLGSLSVGDNIAIAIGPNAKDGCDGFDLDYQLELNEDGTQSNQPPSISHPGDQSSQADSPVTLAISASDPDQDPLTYSLSGAPTGLSIDSATGVISGTPTQAGLYNVSVTASDGQASTSTNFNWHITAVSSDWQPVTNYLQGLANTTAGWQYQWNETGPVGNSANYSDMVFNGSRYNSTGLPGRPTDDELRYGIIGLTGSHPGAGQAQGAVDDRYVIAAYQVSHSGNYRIADSSIGLTACAFSNGLDLRVYVNDNPVQQQLVPGNTTSQFDGGLGTLNSGDTVYVAVGPNQSDGCDGYAIDYSLEIDTSGQSNQPPTIDNPGDQSHFVDTPLSLAINASDLDGDALSYSLSGAPSGLSIDSQSGLISGTPNTVGEYTTTVSVSDGIDTASTSFNWSITPVNGTWQTIAGYQADYQQSTPTQGWRYLWNGSGAIGNAAAYDDLLWAAYRYDSDGVPGNSTTDEFSAGHLGATRGHPGKGTGQGVAADRYAIAAYDIDTAGDYRLSSSQISKIASCAFSNGLDLRVYVNDSLIAQQFVPGDGTVISFDTALGSLSPGDVIYVGAGPNGSDGCDGFGWDFSIDRM